MKLEIAKALKEEICSAYRCDNKAVKGHTLCKLCSYEFEQ